MSGRGLINGTWNAWVTRFSGLTRVWDSSHDQAAKTKFPWLASSFGTHIFVSKPRISLSFSSWRDLGRILALFGPQLETGKEFGSVE